MWTCRQSGCNTPLMMVSYMDFYRISIINTEGLYVKKKGIIAKFSIWYCDKTVSSFPHSLLYTFFYLWELLWEFSTTVPVKIWLHLSSQDCKTHLSIKVQLIFTVQNSVSWKQNKRVSARLQKFFLSFCIQTAAGVYSVLLNGGNTLHWFYFFQVS